MNVPFMSDEFRNMVDKIANEAKKATLSEINNRLTEKEKEINRLIAEKDELINRLKTEVKDYDCLDFGNIEELMSLDKEIHFLSARLSYARKIIYDEE